VPAVDIESRTGIKTIYLVVPIGLWESPRDGNVVGSASILNIVVSVATVVGPW
jgi:hypothetical protein